MKTRVDSFICNNYSRWKILSNTTNLEIHFYIDFGKFPDKVQNKLSCICVITDIEPNLPSEFTSVVFCVDQIGLQMLAVALET